MKETKAFIHRNRAADVIRALQGAGYGNLSVVDVKGMLAVHLIPLFKFLAPARCSVIPKKSTMP